MLWRTKSCVVGGSLALLVIFGAGSAIAHTVDEAEQTLYQRGFRDIRLERATLPYSFNGCRGGVRYHIHVGYYGELVQLDAMGPCNGYGNGYGPGYEGYDSRYRYRGPGYYGGRAPYNGGYQHR